MASTPDHRWLMQYNIVNLVNQCRRLIKAEFDDALSLTDPMLRNKLAHYAGHSRSQGLQRLYGEIRLALIELEGEDPPPPPRKETTPPVRLYRGQPVENSPRQSEQTQHLRPSREVLYRGRKVAQS